jgi:hypothetical protein
MHISDAPWAQILKARVLRGSTSIHYHIYSSLWSSFKSENDLVVQNSSWNLGDGNSINFWRDNWCSTNLAAHFNLPSYISDHLQAKVCDFIGQNQWKIPGYVSNAFLNITSLILDVTIPNFPTLDQKVWNLNVSGALTLKDAYLLKSPQSQHFHWAKTIWSPDIPPSKSFLSWRLIHGKLPTDENLMCKGCSIASMCSICGSAADSEGEKNTRRGVELCFEKFFVSPKQLNTLIRS